jgi:hypothetical protein
MLASEAVGGAWVDVDGQSLPRNFAIGDKRDVRLAYIHNANQRKQS